MDRTLNIDQIVNQIEKLDYNNKLNILSRIVALLKKKDKPNEVYPITSLKGLGKDMWHKTDIEAYIEKERESWD